MLAYQIVIKSIHEDCYLWLDKRVYSDREYLDLQNLLRKTAYEHAAEFGLIVRYNPKEGTYLLGDTDGVFGKMFIRDLYYIR